MIVDVALYFTRSALKMLDGGVMVICAGKYADAVDANDVYAMTCACVV